MADIQSQIQELQAEVAKLGDEGKVDREQWRKWQEGKIAYEKDMQWSLGFLLDKPIVTVTQPDP